MTDEQWKTLTDVIDGQVINPLPAAFIIDSPWLPGWAGMSIRDYYEDDEKWLEANLKAVRTFPDIMFLPGFWSEFGMCTEPSAFGSECVWHENELPFAEVVMTTMQQVHSLKVPRPAVSGLCPLVLERLQKHEPAINAEGHKVRFAVSRGPLNLASFLLGNTNFLMGMHINPEECVKLLEILTAFIINWLRLQKKTFPSIDGIFILDDIVGFIGEDDFKKYALPSLKYIFKAFDSRVRFFHNDAQGRVCAPYLSEMGVNLFNFSFEHSLTEMREWAGDEVTLLGNIPPRDVLAAAPPHEVTGTVKRALASLDDTRRVLLSCGGGMPPDVSTENIHAFMKGVRNSKA